MVDLCHSEEAGWDLLTALRQEAATQQISVILVSTSKKYLERAKEEHAIWGGNRYLLKPFDLEELLRMIQELIGKA
jgi:DNA-binding response OmpR family regulator